ncbi:hypothetical protein GV819_15010 [Pseudomonas sp. Fl5BN2]|uniref:hypothetical protein n=1 Tax=unclassified Pseudomonas TaxID=196821 RepID=UPI001378CA35|nr:MULTISPECIES: hypothetical protein [unclassified Pseudomonas]NBF03601.1 hypothetical protein [Pseudomonas sp. Fl5BN2]NBF12718.1 hypothetical protein [Pseudomonas sp. Fl4BN1]
MTQSNHVLELAVFTVKEGFECQMPQLRVMLREALRGFDGLIEFLGYCPEPQGRMFADLAKWDSLEHAQKVARAFADGDLRFAPYAQAIETLTFMGHFYPE